MLHVFPAVHYSMTDAIGTIRHLVHSLLSSVLCVLLYVHMFAYVGGCGSCCLPNVCQVIFLFHVRYYETLKKVKSHLTHIFAVSLSYSLFQQSWYGGEEFSSDNNVGRWNVFLTQI